MDVYKFPGRLCHQVRGKTDKLNYLFRYHSLHHQEECVSNSEERGAARTTYDNDKERELGTPRIFNDGSRCTGGIGAAAVTDTSGIKRGCQMGDDDILTVYVTEVRGVEIAPQLIPRSWYRTPGRDTGGTNGRMDEDGVEENEEEIKKPDRITR